MIYSDDDLDRLFRSARPPAPDLRLDAHAIQVRESIIRGTYSRSRPRSRRRAAWAGATAATAATAAVIVGAVNVVVPTHATLALAPPPLEYSSAGPLDDVLSQAEHHLLAEPDVAQASTVHSVTWGWDVEMASQQVEIIPQENTFEWSEDGGSISTTVAGDSYWSDNERPEGVGPSPHSPGQLIDQVVTSPDDFTLAPGAVNFSGSTENDLETALAVFGAEPDSSSGELLSAIAGLMQYWTLDDEQQATLIHLLDDAGGLTVLGETTDRLGRTVIGVNVSQVTVRPSLSVVSPRTVSPPASSSSRRR